MKNTILYYLKALLLLALINSCSGSKSEKPYEDKLMLKFEFLAKEYLKINELNTNLNMQIEKVNDYSIYLSIYPFSRTTDSNLPHYISNLSNTKNISLFFYNEDKQIDEKSIINILEERNLLIDFEKEPYAEIVLDGGITWHCFLCLDDIDKYKIVKSPYVLLPKEINKYTSACKDSL